MSSIKQNGSLMRASAGAKPHRLFLYLPSRRRDGSAIEEFEEISGNIARLLCGRFGGATSYPATGHFLRESGEIQTERLQVLEFYCSPEKLREEEPFIHDLACGLREQLSQESIAVSVDGTLVLIPSREKE